MSVKSTIKYGNTTIVDQFVEPINTVSISYKGQVVQTLIPGDIKVLNTKDKSFSDYITIGSKVLNTKDTTMSDYISCTVRYTWDNNPVTSAEATALGYTWTTT